ncbi:hypothetical protein THII_3960 [Thioploca ingrica]|uniref:Twin-arginine translocation signal domain-containing protein n=1 Tax=Thioploca ingrica TaxID=40754 RepID=A0A090APN5_9GAMM|nr:hypothetical protein THII_3960 [Thioploca ingrica]
MLHLPYSSIQYLWDYEISRRDFLRDILATGGLMAAGLSLPRHSWAQPNHSEVIKIGYLLLRMQRLY